MWWTVIFLIISIIAALFGFTGVALVTGGFAKVLFIIFIVLFAISLIFNLFRRGAATVKSTE